MKKYTLRTDLTHRMHGTTLYRIEYSDQFHKRYPYVLSKLGGWIESEKNLSQDGECFIDEGCFVYQNAKVTGNARLSLTSTMYGNAILKDNVCVWNSMLWDSAIVKDYAQVNNAYIYGNATLSNYANVEGGTFKGNAKVHGCATIGGNPTVQDDVELCGKLYMSGNATLLGTQNLTRTGQVVTFNVNFLDITITPHSIALVKHQALNRRGGPIQTFPISAAELETFNPLTYDSTLLPTQAAYIKTMVINIARLLKKETP